MPVLYRRYAIADETMLREGAANLDVPISRFTEGKPIRGTYSDWLLC